MGKPTVPPERHLLYCSCVAGAPRQRLAVVAASREQMAEKLAQYLHTAEQPEPAKDRRRKPKIGFIFSGQGSHWLGMGSNLLENDPLFRNSLVQSDEWLRRNVGWSPIEVLTDERHQSMLAQTEILQPVLFALQVALSARWQAWGVSPDAVVGHGVGEVAAAQVGGALTLNQALEVVINRGRLMQRASGKGMMASVAATVAEARELIREYGDRLSIAAINGPQAVTLSGDADAMQTLLKTLGTSGRFHKVLSVDCAFHSAHMAPYQAELTAVLDGTLTPGGPPAHLLHRYRTAHRGPIAPCRLLGVQYPRAGRFRTGDRSNGGLGLRDIPRNRARSSPAFVH